MGRRPDLHEELCTILGNRNVYFTSPESPKMNYDAIRYKRTGVSKNNANNKTYKTVNEYEVITITRDPDSDLPDRICSHFSMCRYMTAYVANGLNHTVLRLYY